MTPIQQLMLGVGASKKTYMDDVFSTYLYTGSGSARQIVNGIDLSGEGGLVWIKNRDASDKHILGDTVRGVNKYLSSNSTAAETNDGSMIQASNSNGFNVGAEYEVNTNGEDYSSWSFRKAKGFFDVVTYNGSSGTSDISHNLGCIPGLIILKITNGTGGWWVYHRDLPATTNAAWSKVLRLDSSGAEQDAYNLGTASYHTATTFRVGNDNSSNTTGNSYVAYLFAGGESTAATANSASFAADVCYTDSSSNYTLGTSDFTLEYWYKADSNPSSGNSSYIVDYNDDDWATRIQPDGTHQYMVGDTARITSTTSLGEGQWNHIAIVRSSGTSRMYVNGVQEGGTYSDSTDYSFTQFYMGRRYNGTNQLYGKISNLRLVVGTAVYTSSFRPPTEPLTNITNTKLLGLNSSSVTGTTVGTIQISGNTDLSPTASTDSPFDDPAGFKFGEAGDQNVIKCGSYVGNGSSTGPEINLGWEPQWLLIKSASSNDSWLLLDAMRGVVTGGNEASLEPNLSDAEYNSSDWIEFTSTGWKIKGTHDILNGSGNTYIFTAIRRSDGYVGKPADAGTGVLAMDTGAGGSTVPGFDSGFPVDFALTRQTASSDNWYTYSRLMGHKRLKTDTTGTEDNDSSDAFDSNVGWYGAIGNHYQAWLWKRHAGFDVVTYKGNSNAGGVFQTINHNLGKTPEMIWIKNRTESRDWAVGHKGLDGGTNPWQHYVVLNSNSDENGSLSGGVNIFWGNGAPNATHFNVGDWNTVNENNKEFIAMLFASIDGISKVGYYSGSNSAQTITTGFQPRFVIIKNASMSSQYTNWFVLDTTRGWGSGDDKYLKLNDSSSEANHDFGYPTSNGFYLTGDSESYNQANSTFIYYAHA